MKTKLIMTVALLATFANAQFFTNALASQLKQEQQQTADTAMTDNAEPQAVTIDIDNDHAELVKSASLRNVTQARQTHRIA